MSDLYSGDKDRLLRELRESANKGDTGRGAQPSQEEVEALRALYGQSVNMPNTSVGNIEEPVEVDRMSVRDVKGMRNVAQKSDVSSVSAMQGFTRVIIQFVCTLKGAFSPREAPRSQCSKTGHQCAHCGAKFPYHEK